MGRFASKSLTENDPSASLQLIDVVEPSVKAAGRPVTHTSRGLGFWQLVAVRGPEDCKFKTRTQWTEHTNFYV